MLRAEAERYARLITLEMGKPISESRAEIEKCALGCEHFAERAARYLADEPIATSAARPSGRALTDEWWRNVLANPTNAGLVGYHRKRGGKELHKAAFSGFLPLGLFQQVQQVRQERARRSKQGARYRVYLLSGLARCASCGAQVTACEAGGCAAAAPAQHARCREPSVRAERLEEQLGAWLGAVFVLPAALKVKVAALVRAKARGQGSLQSVERAATVRGAIKRLTDAYTWGALGAADYREQLRALTEQLEHLDTAPDERRMMTAIRVAQDLAASRERARPERRKQLIAELFDAIRVGGGRIVSVRPKTAVMPLVAVTATGIEGKDWRSRPGSNPPVFGRQISVEGLEQLRALAAENA